MTQVVAWIASLVAVFVAETAVAYKVIKSNIETIAPHPMPPWKVGDGIIYEGKRYVVIAVNEDSFVILKTVQQIIKDWRSN